ncbi:4-(cytidine 5'-diphospho)-2-C-methyl-D-erythritol kinase [Pseudactinotalea suaedae]|uniref:4-(cytidine 5'-diphospho)-2-C-methyl-D-erythritol kinase n=1 Tax=Pseudactinotalea suaedae TaxID=1524924 RepID=UPI0012E1D21D|nr:4-(cytidine 5'-diphospho)-2-C-methyl-D-erythritol kinase [Pseudactinotalea suaedae]
MTPSRSVHVRAPGKINVALRVGSARADGYHPLATVFQAVTLYEDVVAEEAETISLTVTGRGADRVPTDSSNLAWRAARLLADATGTDAGAHLRITKGVPTAGGMAGGSADAAAALLACDLLWHTGLAREELGELAAELGADVPFALTGQTAVGVGRGDVLTPALARGRFTWVLALSDQGLSTPEVFRAWDAQNPDPVPVPEIDAELMHALVAGDPHGVARHLVNDLQPAAIALLPTLQDVVDAFEETAALAAIVSGSGPTVAALAARPEDAAEIAAYVAAAGVASDVLVVSGPALGARLVESVVSDPD